METEQKVTIIQALSWLGYPAEDVVTGAKGVVDSISFDLYGCIQAVINPRVDSEGKRGESRWHDISRLKKITLEDLKPATNVVRSEDLVEGPVIKPPVFDFGNGPADKPIP